MNYSEFGNPVHCSEAGIDAVLDPADRVLLVDGEGTVPCTSGIMYGIDAQIIDGRRMLIAPLAVGSDRHRKESAVRGEFEGHAGKS
ncbi:hypothetical protein D3C73_1133220 [compost metagenome]